jgi:hypothetical protein|tara:strand:+ start:528 stop:890 length:363 start_codon:yes stop_codon:yes gene_type:complete
MAIIHTYPRKPVPKKEDLIIISDSDSSNPVNATRSATLESLSDIGLDKTFVFSQSQPQTVWGNPLTPEGIRYVTHGLNKFASVTVVNSANEVVIGNVEYINANKVQLTFSAAFSGKAYFN